MAPTPLGTGAEAGRTSGGGLRLGEWLLDLRTPRKRARLAAVVERWTDRCAADGFAAVEFDNLDSFTRSRGLLRRSHARAFARLIVADAHDAGLPAGQKNLAGFDGTTVGYDFAVSEECGQWRECAAYAEVYGDQVVAVEYRRNGFRRTCRTHGEQWPVVLRDRALAPDGRRRFC
ncbi:endo alpha-1,4 polygalactosaminidase [Nocardioides sambongensis]|uniref:endo alpha-1,4 polygalactosaminidase n=1 Tax=Nocardioides sambongensis TaxID=2589074 RepID=UPI0015E86CD4|nr:endo alpha-1,4 polygalactosaminidase [Nocardioides sambongensis]